MKQEATDGGEPQLHFTAWRCSWKGVRMENFLVMSFVVLCLCLKGLLVSSEDSQRGPLPFYGCASSGGFLDLDFGSESSSSCFGITDMCAGSGSFCFPSTLMDLVEDEASEGLIRGDGTGSSWHRCKNATFKASNGDTISCSLKDSANEYNDLKGLVSCKAPLTMNDDILDLDGNSEATEVDIHNGPSPPHVEISPPVLDWGLSTLYSPSLAFLNVENGNNESVLHVYDLFTTDQQFYASDFKDIKLAPGESTSIAFVFLPKWLGLSSAQIIMQTNFGGFVIRAKGVTVESPYRIESTSGSLNRTFSLYNPSDSVLYVERAAIWISTSSESIDQLASVTCSKKESHPSSSKISTLETDEDWLTVKYDEQGLNWVNIRPHRQWEVPPQSSEAIIEMNLSPHLEGKAFGAICMRLLDSTRNKADTVIFPVIVEAQDKNTYHDLTGSFSVFLEPLVANAGRGSIISLSFRNDASYLLSVVKVTEITEGSKLFQINYIEGFVLYPKTIARIALISYALPTLRNPSEDPNVGFSCEIFIFTNYSSNPLKIPCLDLVHTFSRYQLGSSLASHERSYIGLMLKNEKEKSKNAKTGSLGGIADEQLIAKPHLIDVIEANELILRNWKSQGTMHEMSVLEDREVLFPVVQVGTQFSKWITVRNPSHKPVIMQLVLNTGTIIDACKRDDHFSEYMLTRSGHIDARATQDGFSIADSARTEAFVHPLGTASFGPVIFRASKRCTWRSSALIRNNLSGVEWLPLRAFGGSHSLVILEGSEPVQKLEFILDFPLGFMENASDSCSHQLSKELHAKNTGELPLQVLKVDISGSNRGLGGFMIDNRKNFALAPGESIKLLISYQVDFSTAVVHRDLELAMTTGIFVIPMRAILPVHMLNLCRKSLIRTVLHNPSTLVIAAGSIVLLVFFRFVTHALSATTEYYYVKNVNMITDGKPSRPHRNTKNPTTRLMGEDLKIEASYVSGYPDCPNDDQKRATSSPSMTVKSAVVLDGSGVSQAANGADVRVQNVRETGRRRKRRATGSNLAAKFEVSSSSQSGNSTPSSPLSPNSSTKQIWPQLSERNHKERNDTKVSIKSIVLESGKHNDNTQLISSQHKPHPARLAERPNLLTSTSPIALHARAPGSKLVKEKAIKMEENDVVVQDFTYNIWGNSFSDRFLGEPKEIVSKKVYGGSEGESQSFFAREFGSLVMMPSARSVSSAHKLPPSYEVNRLYEME